MDRRQRRVDVLGEVDVVEADDADVVRDAQAAGRAAPRIAPIAIASLIARTAVGPDGRPARPSSSAAIAALDAGRADDDAVVRELDADRGERLAVAAQAPAGDASRVGSTVDGAGGSTPMTRTSRWPRPMRCSAAARAPPTSSTSIEPWSGSARRVDEDDRHAGPPDLLDLGMVVAQADGDDAVDGRPAHRPGQRCRGAAR